jgi:hypothetical protein
LVAGVSVVAGIVIISGEAITNTAVLLAVLFAGGAGACLQAVTAVVRYIGWRTFQPGWSAFFFLRPLMGGAMSLIVYVGLRALFVQSSLPASQLNYYGILAISFLVGTQSQVVLGRLTEFYDVVLGGAAAVRGSRGVSWPYPEMQTELRRLDRYQGFLVHRVTQDKEMNGFVLAVWLQQDEPPDVPHTHVDIGEGRTPEKITFRVTVYPEMCDVEPPAAELIVSAQSNRSPELKFKLTCPSGVGDHKAYIELSQRGRTVAVAPVSPDGAKW